MPAGSPDATSVTNALRLGSSCGQRTDELAQTRRKHRRRLVSRPLPATLSLNSARDDASVTEDVSRLVVGMFARGTSVDRQLN